MLRPCSLLRCASISRSLLRTSLGSLWTNSIDPLRGNSIDFRRVRGTRFKSLGGPGVLLEPIAITLAIPSWSILRAGGSEGWPLGPVGILALIRVLAPALVLGLVQALGLALLSGSV